MGLSFADTSSLAKFNLRNAKWQSVSFIVTISSNILEKSEFAANSESLIPFIAKSWVFSEIANPRSSCSMIDLDMGKDNEVFLSRVHSLNKRSRISNINNVI
jgi:hypothetical protein